MLFKWKASVINDAKDASVLIYVGILFSHNTCVFKGKLDDKFSVVLYLASNDNCVFNRKLVYSAM